MLIITKPLRGSALSNMLERTNSKCTYCTTCIYLPWPMLSFPSQEGDELCMPRLVSIWNWFLHTNMVKRYRWRIRDL